MENQGSGYGIQVKSDDNEMPLYSEDDSIRVIDRKQYKCVDNGRSAGVQENNKYIRTIYSNKGEITGTEIKAEVDVYDVLGAFNVTCPALQHLTKKALCVGIRGHKNQEDDLKDIIKSAKRALELYEIKKRQI